MGNYMPISLLPSISKIIEKLVHSRLYSFCENNTILKEINMADHSKILLSS